MIVKQVSVDVEVMDSNIDLAKVVKKDLEDKGFYVLGIDQIDLSDIYNKELTQKNIQ